MDYGVADGYVEGHVKQYHKKTLRNVALMDMQSSCEGVALLTVLQYT